MGFREQHMSLRIQLIQTRATQCEREFQDINSAHRDYEASVARINNRLKESWDKLSAMDGTEDRRAIQSSIVGYGGELERLRSHYEADFENAAAAYKSRIDAAWTKFRQEVTTALSLSLATNLTQAQLSGVAEQCTPTSPSYGQHLGLEAALPLHWNERACPSADCDENERKRKAFDDLEPQHCKRQNLSVTSSTNGSPTMTCQSQTCVNPGSEVPHESVQMAARPQIKAPIPGEVYITSWEKSNGLSAVVLLPTTDLEDVGLPYTLHALGLASYPPDCYVCNPDDGTLQWSKGYEDGGPFVAERKYPVMYFDGQEFPVKNAVGWVSARNLQTFDLENTKVRKLINYGQHAWKYVQERDELRAKAKRAKRFNREERGFGEEYPASSGKYDLSPRDPTLNRQSPKNTPENMGNPSSTAPKSDGPAESTCRSDEHAQSKEDANATAGPEVQGQHQNPSQSDRPPQLTQSQNGGPQRACGYGGSAESAGTRIADTGDRADSPSCQRTTIGQLPKTAGNFADRADGNTAPAPTSLPVRERLGLLQPLGGIVRRGRMEEPADEQPKSDQTQLWDVFAATVQQGQDRYAHQALLEKPFLGHTEPDTTESNGGTENSQETRYRVQHLDPETGFKATPRGLAKPSDSSCFSWVRDYKPAASVEGGGNAGDPIDCSRIPDSQLADMARTTLEGSEAVTTNATGSTPIEQSGLLPSSAAEQDSSTSRLGDENETRSLSSSSSLSPLLAVAPSGSLYGNRANHGATLASQDGSSRSTWPLPCSSEPQPCSNGPSLANETRPTTRNGAVCQVTSSADTSNTTPSLSDWRRSSTAGAGWRDARKTPLVTPSAGQNDKHRATIVQFDRATPKTQTTEDAPKSTYEGGWPLKIPGNLMLKLIKVSKTDAPRPETFKESNGEYNCPFGCATRTWTSRSWFTRHLLNTHI
ncbi:hypothetical protein Purlil1_13314 [Purpureocillium lilacinum]|uniref:C2H2-type domain-containing protein n=1 Tax=Purpureocillium lilacinum TaxID=33203 RepID=A0ABR0BF34_PURLI|nr:hypothetical protein Purlil1_13314 [Purpureocillium lilacinum]